METKNPIKQKVARKRAYWNRKIKAFNKIGKLECCKCGCSELEFLEFNHKNGGGCKEWRKFNGKSMTDLILTNKRKVEDLEIVCRVCNALEFLNRKNPIQRDNFIYAGKVLLERKLKK